MFQKYVLMFIDNLNAYITGEPCFPVKGNGLFNPNIDPKDEVGAISQSSLVKAYANFTFIFLPVAAKRENGDAIRLNLFTDTNMETDRLVELPETLFDQLIKLLSDAAIIPQGPCIPQP